jgi:DNA repair exonuclease SbcCD ATPase subunit
MDESRTTKASAYIPYLDETIEKVVDPDYKLSSIRGEELLYQINKEKDRMCDLQKKSLEISQLADSGLESIDNALNDLADLNEKGTGDRDRSRQVQNRINELGSRLDEIEKNIKFPQKLNELKEKLKETEQIVDSFGDEKASQILSNLKPEIEKTIELKNNKRATAVIEKLCKLKFSILFNQPMYWVSVLTNIIESFDEIRWSDHLTARNLINKGSELIVSEQFSDEIKHIVFDLWKLMPESDREKTKAPRTDILHYYKK